MNLITKLTRDCQRQDCQISLGHSATTLIGWSPTYDKHGQSHGRDPNTSTRHYGCAACGKGWKVESRDGEQDKISPDYLSKSTT